ncbi:MAG: hypothetical protein RQ801_05510 [Spirochaetaceae bacterium]|nr:hypothetical protein [Spirochaetaceae bacterium]MDT8297738.1 hypothetical protein [Spirochaetaceae bacterium]
MKMTPELKRAQENMAPGIITAEGFLGSDRRNLSTIIDEDGQVMRHLGLDSAEVAERLQFFMNEGRKGLGEPVTVEEEWLVQTDEARGHLACPWEDGIRRKINVTVERKESGEKLFYTDLSIHLLEAHGFLEGRGSFFRLNLESVKHVLKL